MQTTKLWLNALEALQALGRHYGPEMTRAAAELGITEWYGWLLAAMVFEPLPISAERLRIRTPYTSAQAFNQRLEQAAKQKLLTPVEEGANAYRLTAEGKQAVNRIIQAAYAKMEQLQPLPVEDLERLAASLERAVRACLDAPEPPRKWCLRHSRKTDPGAGAALVIRVDQYLSDLAAYRDDAHLAAWEPLQIEGHAWEAFTLFWRGEAATLDELTHKLARRGYTHQEYQQALEDLVRRGWIKEAEGKFEVTPEGRAIRQTAEETTDRYFAAPWSCLSQAETEELLTLLQRLRDGLSIEINQADSMHL